MGQVGLALDCHGCRRGVDDGGPAVLTHSHDEVQGHRPVDDDTYALARPPARPPAGLAST